MSLIKEAPASFLSQFSVCPENFRATPITTGFLHESFSLSRQDGPEYVLQRLSSVFDLRAINTNLKLFEQAQATSASWLPKYWQPVWYLNVSGSDDKIYYDEEGNAWRTMVHVPGDIRIFNSFNEVPDEIKADIAYSLGEAISVFGKILREVPQDSWQEPLPNLHDSRYHYQYLQSILNGEEVPLSLSHDKTKIVRLDRTLKEDRDLADRSGRLIAKIDRMKHFVSALDGLGTAITHGDLKINNAVFRQDEEGK